MVYIALDWDKSRKQFTDWVFSFGVGCRVICVAPRGASDLKENGKGLQTLPVSDIESGEALWL